MSTAKAKANKSTPQAKAQPKAKPQAKVMPRVRAKAMPKALKNMVTARKAQERARAAMTSQTDAKRH